MAITPEQYLARIGWTAPLARDAATLADLHEAHMLAVPFENLDIHRGREIVLDEERLLAKIVGERRGGFCYELNGAFASLLRAIGFEVTMLSAGVARLTGGFGPDFDHMALMVPADGVPWLVDVGFGDSFRRPLRLAAALDQKGGDPLGAQFRLTVEKGIWFLWRDNGSGAELQYRFTLQPRALGDFSGMCNYHQTSPDSSFTKRKLCSRATPEGRITMSGDRTIVTTAAGREERPLAADEWDSKLREEFGIELA